jgi:hypothetical protein
MSHQKDREEHLKIWNYSLSQIRAMKSAIDFFLNEHDGPGPLSVIERDPEYALRVTNTLDSTICEVEEALGYARVYAHMGAPFSGPKRPEPKGHRSSQPTDTRELEDAHSK